MFKLYRVVFTAIILSLFGANSSFSNTPTDAELIKKEFLGQIEFVQGRLSQLAGAMPQSTMEWRPMEGVRSVSEVYLHTAFANYICVTVSGGTVPEDIGFTMDFSKINEWDTETTDKTEVIEDMNESFDILKKRISELTEEDLNREVEVFGMTMTVRNFVVTMIAHAHEHLGQGIAYARMNGVVPPWSQQPEETEE
ncbi:MAG: DinB family protein [Ignavibacteria bacterium]|jgi:uncharacterized damage-inducible protein DinB